MSSAPDVDTYIANSSSELQPVLEEVRKTIKSAVPMAEEGISWGVPFYKYHGLLAGFSSFRSHVSFGLASDRLEENDREELKRQGYKTGKKIIQIRFDQKVPVEIIKKILKIQMEVNEIKERRG